MSNGEKSVNTQQFHELAMDYRGASVSLAPTAYHDLICHVQQLVDASAAAQESTIVALKEQVSTLQAARMAYANEFPLNADGEPDVGGVHANIRALKEQLAAMECTLRNVGERCHGSSYLLGNDVHRMVCDALASQPAAPVQPLSIEAIRKLALDMCATDAEGHSEEFNDGRAYGIVKMNAALMKLAAPPVQQPGDVRECNACDWKGITDRMLGSVGPLCPECGETTEALATTRPSAALTDEQIMELAEPFGAFEYGDAQGDKRISFAKSILAASSGALAVPEWISVDERLPEAGVPVLVYSPPTQYDHPGDVNISFDCIDPDADDPTYWLNHGEHYEHFCCVAKPEEGCIGPSEKAPYTYWHAIPTAPAIPAQGQTK